MMLRMLRTVKGRRRACGAGRRFDGIGFRYCRSGGAEPADFGLFLSGFLSLTPRAGKQITLGLTEGYKWRDGRDSNPFWVGRLSTT